jgi:hypothetical protein
MVSTGNYCMLVLSPSTTTTQLGAAGTTLQTDNGQKISAPNCGIAVNGAGANAMVVTQGSDIEAKSESIVGNYSTSQGGKIGVTPKTSQSAIADPYAGVANPSPSCATSQNTGGACGAGLSGVTISSGNNNQLYAGTYYGGLTITNGASATLNPGVYIIDGGTFSMQGGTKVTGAGVTIELTGDSNYSYATVNVANGAHLSISAPTSGATSGLVFYADRRSPNTSVSSFAGGAIMDFDGALYFPSQELDLSNGVDFTGAACSQLIAYYVHITGGATFNSSCTNNVDGTASIGNTQKIVE